MTGEKRLPRFSGEWKANRLRNITTRHTKRNTIGNTNVLTISAQYGLINQAEFFNKAVANEDKSNYFLLEKGDFAYNKSYSNGYPFGAIKRLTRYEVGIVSPLYICFRIKEGSVSGEYLEQYFEAALVDGHCEGKNMTEQEMQEHVCKDLLKKVVDNGQNYTEKMKSDLKEIIDHGKSPEEICEATLAYFAMCRWQ